MKLLQLLESKNGLAETLKRHCKNNLKQIVDTNLRLLRGVDGHNQAEDAADKWWFESPVRKLARTSQTGNNIAMVWTAHHESWKGIPRRAFSSSCTTSVAAANSFGGSTYLVIPFDNVKAYAYCPMDFNFYSSDKDNATAPDLLRRLNLVREIQETAHELSDVISDAPYGPKDPYVAQLKPIMEKYASIIKLDVGKYDDISQIWKLSDCIQELRLVFSQQYHSGDLHREMEDLRDLIQYYEHDFKASPTSWLKQHLSPEAMHVTVHSDLANLPQAASAAAPEIWFEGQYVGITDAMDDDWVANEPLKSTYFKSLVKQVLG